MFNYKVSVLFLSFVIYFTDAYVRGSNVGQAGSSLEDAWKSELSQPTDINTLSELNMAVDQKDKIDVKLFYEALCPDCIRFYPKFAKAVLKLYKYLDVHVYPFGNARIMRDNGQTVIKCQHGEAECYGNKLHACALDIFHQHWALLYNSCLMEHRSNDEAADWCAKHVGNDSRRIKNCAKSEKGFQLLLNYGTETSKFNLRGVPYVIINGTEFDTDEDFLQKLCSYFNNKPHECFPTPPHASKQEGSKEANYNYYAIA